MFGSNWNRVLLPQLNACFAEEVTGQIGRYALGDRLRTRLLNYCAISMMNSLPGTQLMLKHFTSVFNVMEKHARQIFRVIGARVMAQTGESSSKEEENVEKSDGELWKLIAPVKLPRIRANGRK